MGFLCETLIIIHFTTIIFVPFDLFWQYLQKAFMQCSCAVRHRSFQLVAFHFAVVIVADDYLNEYLPVKTVKAKGPPHFFSGSPGHGVLHVERDDFNPKTKLCTHRQNFPFCKI